MSTPRLSIWMIFLMFFAVFGYSICFGPVNLLRMGVHALTLLIMAFWLIYFRGVLRKRGL
jgi:hypothetical protein